MKRHNVTSPIIVGREAHFFFPFRCKEVAVVGEMNDWNSSKGEMRKLRGSKIFHRSFVLPFSARIEYKLVVDGKWINDPHNPRRAPGNSENSELLMPGFRLIPPLRSSSKLHGKLNRIIIQSHFLKRNQSVTIYLPHKSTIKRRPKVLFVTDGHDYLQFANMKNILDSLIALRRIEPIVAVFIDPRVNPNNPRSNRRLIEYSANDSYIWFLEFELTPWLKKQYRVKRDTNGWAILGASMGGLQATYTVLTRSRFLRKCAAQSPAYFEANTKVICVADKAKNLEGIRLWTDTGTIGDTDAEARLVTYLLRKKGATVWYSEYPEGHNWTNWRQRLPSALEFLFPPS